MCLIDFLGSSVMFLIEICFFDVNENFKGIFLFVDFFFEYVLLNIMIGFLIVCDLDFGDNYMFVLVINLNDIFLIYGNILRVFKNVDYEIM